MAKYIPNFVQKLISPPPSPMLPHPPNLIIWCDQNWQHVLVCVHPTPRSMWSRQVANLSYLAWHKEPEHLEEDEISIWRKLCSFGGSLLNVDRDMSGGSPKNFNKLAILHQTRRPLFKIFIQLFILLSRVLELVIVEWAHHLRSGTRQSELSIKTRLLTLFICRDFSGKSFLWECKQF